MTLRWESVCVDSAEPAGLARWWAELIGWRVTHEDPEEVVLQPPAGGPAAGVVPDLYFFAVDDPKVARNRVRLDLRPHDHDTEVARARAMGATRVDGGPGDATTRAVLADPDGNELGIVRDGAAVGGKTAGDRVAGAGRDGAMSLRWQSVCIDTPDPAGLARWWAELLGWRITYEDKEEVVLEPPAGSPEAGVAPDLLFLQVDDPKVAKNRLHLDFRPDDRDAEVARAEALGATRVDIGQGEQTWVVLADPEGNEFCILRAFTPEEEAEQAAEAATALASATDGEAVA